MTAETQSKRSARVWMEVHAKGCAQSSGNICVCGMSPLPQGAAGVAGSDLAGARLAYAPDSSNPVPLPDKRARA